MKVLRFIYNGKIRRVIVERETPSIYQGWDIPSNGYRSFLKNKSQNVIEVTDTPLAQSELATFQRLGCV